MRGVSVLLAVGLSLMTLSAAAGPLDVLQDCAARAAASGAQDRRLVELCPDVPDALKALSLDRQIPIDPAKTADFAVLSDLAALAARYGGDAPTAAPHTASLAGIAEQVNGKAAMPEAGWWERLKTWIRQWFSKGSGNEPGWFKRLSESKSLITALFYACVALIAIIAVVIVVNELRAAGLVGRSRRAAPADPLHAKTALLLGVAEDVRSPLTQLLFSLVAQLVRIGSLQADRALTHRELVARSRFTTDDEQQVFARVALSAESATYGPSGWKVPAEVLSDGESLLARLRNLEAPTP